MILRRVVWVSVGCGVWAPSWRELHLTWRWWRVGGRTLVSFSPWGPKLHGHVQSRWELNYVQSTVAFKPHSKHCFFSWYLMCKPMFLYRQGSQTETFTVCVTQPQSLHTALHAPCKWDAELEHLLGNHEQNDVFPLCLWPMGNQIASGFVSSTFIFICSELLSSQLLKLKVDKRAWTTRFLQLSKYWFTSGFCKKMTWSPTNI